MTVSLVFDLNPGCPRCGRPEYLAKIEREARVPRSSIKTTTYRCTLCSHLWQRQH